MRRVLIAVLGLILAGTADPILFGIAQLLFPDRVPAPATPMATPSS